MIVLLGLGRETRELARRLRTEEPATPMMVLDEQVVDADSRAWLTGLDIELRAPVDFDEAGSIPADARAVYRSPGVSPYRPALARVRAMGVAMTTPTGWWVARRDNRDVIAVTGTKGKSTTAAMIAHLLRAAGRQVALVGNIGRAALHADDEVLRAQDVVLELSSYQLTDLDARLGLGVVTTLLQDHVPWHGSVARYHADKLRLLELADAAIVPPTIATHPAIGPDHRVTSVTVGADRARIADALAAAGLHGAHLVDDAAVALAAVDHRLAPPGGVAELADAFVDFTPLPHRLTPVGAHAGVRYVDDSISTVPESAVAAVAAYRDRGPVTVLLGGDDRGQDLAPLVTLLEDEGVQAVLLPPLGDRLAPALRDAGERVRRAEDLPAAVAMAAAITPAGGSVLLSPAAPSFATYRDFVARGEHFVELVTQLGTEEGGAATSSSHRGG